MAVTTTYSLDQLSSATAFTFSNESGSDSDILVLAGGGRVTAVQDTDGFVDLAFYDAAGSQINTDTGNGGGTHGALAQTKNGTIVLAANADGGGVFYNLYSADGTFVSRTLTDSTTRESNADVAALTTSNRFVVVDQADFTDATADDHDIHVHVRSATGGTIVNITVDASTANDQNATVAGLADGGFAVAWERIDGDGHSTGWVAVYDKDGAVVTAPTEFDNLGTLNHEMKMSALADGGFSVAYEDNESGNSDISIATFDATGGIPLSIRSAVTVGSEDSQAGVATLSNGLVIATYTNLFNPGDHDIRATLFDPETGNMLTPTDADHMLQINYDGGSDTVDAAVSATGLAQFLVSYSNLTTGAVTEEHYQLVRTSVGDDSGNTINGDDAVDIETGGAAADTLNGAGNNDTLDGAGGDDFLDIGSGISDTALGGEGDDTIYVHGELHNTDRIDGGANNPDTFGDTVVLDGAYGGGLTLDAETVVNVETIRVLNGNDYNLTSNDATVAAGATLRVTGDALGAAHALIFDGSAETDGSFYLIDGQGNDRLTGGAGDDTIYSVGGGQDTINGGLGGDVIYFYGGALSASDQVDGGDGSDSVVLYGSGDSVTFNATTMVNVEDVSLFDDGSFTLTTNDQTVAAVQIMTFDGSLLTTSHTFTFDGSRESDGRFVILGGGGNDALTGGMQADTVWGNGGDDTINLSFGGNDHAKGGAGDDTFNLGAAFTAHDVIDGGGNEDVVVLNGNYAATVLFNSTTMVNVETIRLTAGHSYSLTPDEATTAAGKVLVIDGSALGASDSMIINGVHEHDGRLVLKGGAGSDILAGGAGNDVLRGGDGADAINLSFGGNDTVIAGAGADNIVALAAFGAADKIDGGADFDNLQLNGDYAAGVVFNGTTLRNVEYLTLFTGHSYKFVTAEHTVAAGQTLTVDGTALSSGDTLTMDGEHETDGFFAFSGGAGNDVLTGGKLADGLFGNGGDDTLNANRGGDDTVGGGVGNDIINMGSKLTAADTIDGGSDNDTVLLKGNYGGAGVIFGTTTMRGVETIHLATGFNYNLTLNDETVDAGATLTVDGSDLGAANAITIAGGSELDGMLVLKGGGGADTLTGGAGNDTITGGIGADRLTGGGGNDTFVYASVNQSKNSGYDKVVGFDFSAADKLDLNVAVSGIDATVHATVSTASFDSDLQSAVGAGQLALHHAVIFAANGGSLAGHTYLIVNANGSAGYQAGADYIMELASAVHIGSIDASDFV